MVVRLEGCDEGDYASPEPGLLLFWLLDDLGVQLNLQEELKDLLAVLLDLVEFLTASHQEPDILRIDRLMPG